MRVEQIASKALEKVGDDRYKLSLMVAKRAKELANGATPLINIEKSKYKFADIAMMEIAEDKLTLEALVENN